MMVDKVQHRALNTTQTDLAKAPPPVPPPRRAIKPKRLNEVRGKAHDVHSRRKVKPTPELSRVSPPRGEALQQAQKGLPGAPPRHVCADALDFHDNRLRKAERQQLLPAENASFF
jgi:hypothetical protein